MTERGAAVVSIDTELAWGDAHRGVAPPSREYRAERAVIERILAVFDRYEIPATWAVVGHLLLDRCWRLDGRAHPEIIRPDYPWLDGDWFAVDPCATLRAAPTYYGRDIVEAITARSVDHEIGCHSFSHLIAEGCSDAAFASDLEACTRAAAAEGIELRSFVYPRNAIDHIELLGRHGFVCYRGSTASGSTQPTGRWARLADRVRPRSVVRPVRHPSGVWNVPQTYLLAPASRARHLPVRLWVRRPISRLRLAAREGALFHLWFHPYNVTAAPERAMRALEAICAEAARLRDAGHLDVLTMGALADRLDDTSTRGLSAS
jgi:peptidoglycan/xylan/chitin deacetylase (PgdA/CDA1 family)